MSTNKTFVMGGQIQPRRNYLISQERSLHYLSNIAHSAFVPCLRTYCSVIPGSLAGEEWPEYEFVKVAEETLETISEEISSVGYGENNSLSDFDVELSQGVLTVSLGAHGIYVLNTQTPNRQIWMSSPFSGPSRYSWDIDSRKWISSRDGHSLSERLTKEFSQIFEEDVNITANHLSL